MREYIEIPKEKPQFASPEELEALRKKGPEPLTGKALVDFEKAERRRQQELDFAAELKKRDYANWKDMAWDKQFEGGLKSGQRIKVTYDLEQEVENSFWGKIVYVGDPTSDDPYVIVKPDRGNEYYHIIDAGEIELDGDTPDTFYWTINARKVIPSKSKKPIDDAWYEKMKDIEDWGESLSFKQFIKLQEVGTSTGDVAAFKRITIPGQIKRQFPPWGDEDPFFKKKRRS